MCLFKSQDREFILVVLLVELAKQTPCLPMPLVLLNFGLKAQDRFLNSPLLNECFSNR